MDPQVQKLVVLLLIGLVGGYLASWIVGGSGVIKYLVSGVIGAFVGGYLLRALNVDLHIGNALLTDIVTATIGAIVVSLVAKLIA